MWVRQARRASAFVGLEDMLEGFGGGLDVFTS